MNSFTQESLSKIQEVGEITIKVVEKSPCLVKSGNFKISAKADRALDGILAVLHLALPSSKYSEAFQSLNFRFQGRLIAIFSSGQINLACFKEEEEAKKVLEGLRKLVNKALEYFKKHGKPDSQLLRLRKKLSPQEIYNYLPRTNCKECKEQGCFAFAVKLFNGERALDECPVLKQDQYNEKRRQLEKMVQPIKI